MGWNINIQTQGFAALEPIGAKMGDIAEKLQFLQSWLFFGMLSELLEVFALHVNMAEFVRMHRGRALISTIPLRD
jgi:hypothetical protein